MPLPPKKETQSGRGRHNQQARSKNSLNNFRQPGTQKRHTEKRDSAVDLAHLLNQKVRVKFVGGREVVGILCGFDPLVNLVLDKCIEYQRDLVDSSIVTHVTRQLGKVVCRGTSVVVVSPEENAIQIENPFISAT